MARSHAPTITAGAWRGRRLDVPEGRLTRPTRSLVRQALFNMLGPDLIADARVLDLYSGSGALGLEALSRGARAVVFVEQHPRALACLRANIERCGASPAEALVLAADAGRVQPPLAEPFDLVTADPPFALRDALPEVLADPACAPPGTWLAFHGPQGGIIPRPPGPWERDRSRDHGRSSLHLFVRTG